MAIRLIELALGRQDVKGSTKLVLIGLANHTNDAGICWPSIDRLRQAASLAHARHVYEALDKLAALGLIVREAQPGRTTIYRLNLGTPDAAVTPDEGVTPDESVTCDAAVTPDQNVTPPLTSSSLPPLTIPSPTPDASVTQTVKEPSGEPSVTRQTLALAWPATTTEGPEGFETFWKLYPKKRAKADALKAWRTLNPAPDLIARIVTAVDDQKRSLDWTKDGGKWIPYPATWLRGGQWDDELFAAVPVNTNTLNSYAKTEGFAEDLLAEANAGVGMFAPRRLASGR